MKRNSHCRITYPNKSPVNQEGRGIEIKTDSKKNLQTK
jgi:hypothetical protein